MSYAVSVALVFWIPCIVFASVAGALAASWKGRAAAEGFVLGLVLGVFGWLIEVFLPASGRYAGVAGPTRQGRRPVAGQRPTQRA